MTICRHLNRQVIDSRPDDSGERIRKCICHVCGARFFTREVEIDTPKDVDPDIIDAVLAMRKIGITYPVIMAHTCLSLKAVQQIELGK